ncbi:uncharacterized protein LY89DRAFT_677250 [Mollisia scopiformis]|uniref:Uncharacterized protein n=1 Tax=Mollisia scopiformis TaxID=149040 RepID=A0A132B7E7_MOLSC|nr:uncharacterized protein LY89DRAFT_677250 [Mollisia scopiformis]KUJ07919.1 hypothetical protein LY89DRAFT_677250 [Mollisia scopiformis]
MRPRSDPNIPKRTPNLCDNTENIEESLEQQWREKEKEERNEKRIGEKEGLLKLRQKGSGQEVNAGVVSVDVTAAHRIGRVTGPADFWDSNEMAETVPGHSWLRSYDVEGEDLTARTANSPKTWTWTWHMGGMDGMGMGMGICISFRAAVLGAVGLCNLTVLNRTRRDGSVQMANIYLLYFSHGRTDTAFLPLLQDRGGRTADRIVRYSVSLLRLPTRGETSLAAGRVPCCGHPQRERYSEGRSGENFLSRIVGFVPGPFQIQWRGFAHKKPSPSQMHIILLSLGSVLSGSQNQTYCTSLTQPSAMPPTSLGRKESYLSIVRMFYCMFYEYESGDHRESPPSG